VKAIFSQLKWRAPAALDAKRQSSGRAAIAPQLGSRGARGRRRGLQGAGAEQSVAGARRLELRSAGVTPSPDEHETSAGQGVYPVGEVEIGDGEATPQEQAERRIDGVSQRPRQALLDGVHSISFPSQPRSVGGGQ